MQYGENYKAALIISDEAVQAALTADQGEEAKLDTWTNVPFPKKRNNSIAFVTSIQVKFKKGNQNEQISYVVKLNPYQPKIGTDWPHFVKQIFEKERNFYLEILPELNNFLTETGQKPLPFPKCYYAQYLPKKDMLILEDLRLKQFKKMDRRKGMDLQHALLVIQGLGYLHAASMFILKKTSIDTLKSRYPFLFDEFWAGKMIDDVIAPSLENGKELLLKVGGHENAINWIDLQLPNIPDFLEKNHASSPPFNVICHGDCFNNNILFRYNESGLPVEMMFLDLQLTRLASLATDLNYFMFLSMEGAIRKPNVDLLLTEYYASFSSIIKGCGQDLPFTKEELVKEYKNKNAYGLVFGTFLLPEEYLEGEDSLDVNPENIEEFIEQNKPRFVAMYDEMLEEGLFS